VARERDDARVDGPDGAGPGRQRGRGEPAGREVGELEEVLAGDLAAVVGAAEDEQVADATLPAGARVERVVGLGRKRPQRGHAQTSLRWKDCHEREAVGPRCPW